MSGSRYQELADHYGTAIVPARVRKPDDKAAAEGSVRFVSTWITAALRDRTFFSITEAQQAVSEKLEEINRKPFQKRVGCRLSAFEQEEKAFLQPLPVLDYEPSVWSRLKVGTDYLVSDGRNKYSVPYDLIGETVDVRLTRNIVEVYYRGDRVAVHVRLAAAQWEPVVKPEHMPEAHRKYMPSRYFPFLVVVLKKVNPRKSKSSFVPLNLPKGSIRVFSGATSSENLLSRFGSTRITARASSSYWNITRKSSA